MNYDISVIVPVYNAQDHLRECLDGICNQSIKNIEIICVNDGSTDSSLQILNEYALKDKRIRIVNQCNSGAGAARNAGLEIASGEYLSFLDADDLFEPEMLCHSYELAKQTHADVCVFYADLYDNNTHDYIECSWDFRREFFQDRVPFDPMEYPNNENIFRMFNGWPWDKIYRRDFILKNGLRFQEIQNTEDMYFVFMSLIKAKKIVTLDENLLHQRINIGTSVSQTRERTGWDCFYLGLKAMKDEMVRTNVLDHFNTAFCNWVVNFSLWYMNSIKGMSFFLIYNLLRDDALKEFGVLELDKKHFFDENELAEVEYIMSHTAEEYLNRLREEKIPQLEKTIANCFEDINTLKADLDREIGRALAFIEKNKAQKKTIKTLEEDIKKKEKQIKRIERSYSYKIGRIITFIPRWIKKILTR